MSLLPRLALMTWWQSALDEEDALPLLDMALRHVVSPEAQRAHLPKLLATLLRRCERHALSLSAASPLEDALRLSPLLSLALRLVARLDVAATLHDADLRDALAHLHTTFVHVRLSRLPRPLTPLTPSPSQLLDSLLAPQWQREWSAALSSKGALGVDPAAPSPCVRLVEALTRLLVALSARVELAHTATEVHTA